MTPATSVDLSDPQHPARQRPSYTMADLSLVHALQHLDRSAALLALQRGASPYVAVEFSARTGRNELISLYEPALVYLTRWCSSKTDAPTVAQVTDLMALMVAHGADTTQLSPYGEDLLVLALGKYQPALVDVLLRLGAPCGVDARGRTLLHRLGGMSEAATRTELQQMGQRLMEAGVPLEGEDRHGRTPLMAALADEANAGGIEALVRLGARVLPTRDTQPYPLMLLARNAHLDAGHGEQAERILRVLVPAMIAAGQEQPDLQAGIRTAMEAAQQQLTERVQRGDLNALTSQRHSFHPDEDRAEWERALSVLATAVDALRLDTAMSTKPAGIKVRL